MAGPLHININDVHDIINSLNGAANSIQGELSDLENDIKKTLDFTHWTDNARDVYDVQQRRWHNAAQAMHQVLDDALPTLTNMVNNITTNEQTNLRAWSSVFEG